MRRTLGRAARHAYLSLRPVNIGVVAPEPRKPEDHICLPQRTDGKGNALGMITEAHNQLYLLSDRAAFIESPVHVVHRDRGFEPTSPEIVFSDVHVVNKLGRSAAIDQRTC